MSAPPYSAEHYKRAVAFVLRKLRRKAGLSLEAAAGEAGMDRAYLGKLEAGKHEPGGYRLAKLAGVYEEPQLNLRIERRALVYYKQEQRRRK